MSWLNYILVLERNINRDMVALERVSANDCVCHGQKGASEGFFYMYMCHFSQLHPIVDLEGIFLCFNRDVVF